LEGRKKRKMVKGVDIREEALKDVGVIMVFKHKTKFTPTEEKGLCDMQFGG